MRTLYRASRVHTFSMPPVGEWILVDGRHVQRVGSGEPPQADRVVELPGATVIPGLIDTHVHLTGTGVNVAHPEIEAARSGRQLVTAVRAIMAGARGPVLLHGFDESLWDDPRLPTLADLDQAAATPYLLMRIDGHLALGNSSALEASEVSEVEGLERDPDGGPTGVVTREANNRLKRWASMQLDEREIQELQLAAASIAASRGVTCVHEMSLPAERGLRDLEVLLGHRQRLPVDVVTYLGTTDLPQVMDLGLPGVGGDLPVDGSLGARTAALSAPYADRPSESGARYFGDDELAEFFHGGHAAGLQVGVHAIGDDAIEQVVGTWERVYGTLDSRERRHFRKRRHRIEHFEMATDVQIERAAMLGLAISVQPSFDTAWGASGALYEQRLGRDRAFRMNAIRSCLDRGIEIGVGSDSPITTLDPMATIVALERHHDPSQRLSRSESLHLSTNGGARLAHQEEKKGVLEPGMHADFVAYDVDPTTEHDLAGVRPTLTVSLGREVFAS